MTNTEIKQELERHLSSAIHRRSELQDTGECTKAVDDDIAAFQDDIEHINRSIRRGAL